MNRDTEFEKYRQRWAAGDFRAAIDAFEHCCNWSEPLPDWLAAAVWSALQITFVKGGAPGRGKTGSFATQATRADAHYWRYLVASTCKSRSDKDLEPARARLAKTVAEGSIAAIRASYYRVRKQLRNSS